MYFEFCKDPKGALKETLEMNLSRIQMNMISGAQMTLLAGPVCPIRTAEAG